MFGVQFYPTPPDLISKMLAGLDYLSIKTALEPSAGKGDIVERLKRSYKTHAYSRNELDVDCIEIDSNLRNILTGNGHRVIHDDFLTFHTFKHYDLIIMNPPFADGDKHLLKALELQERGGQVICLLNAETLKNPYSNTRKELVRKLSELDAEIQYLEGEFSGAERKTNVEIALIKVNIAKEKKDGLILTGLKREEYVNAQSKYENQVTSNDFVTAIIERYNFEVKAGIKLLEEYFSMMPLIMNSFNKGGHKTPIIELKITEFKADNLDVAINDYIKKVRYKYWEQLFQSKEFMNLLTNDLQRELHSRVQELVNYDFSHYNIIELKMQMNKKLIKSVEDTIIELFDELSHKHSYYDGSENVHYYDGWKTNKAWKINRRVIIRLRGYHWGEFRPEYNAKRKLRDIEKVFDYLDGGRTDHTDSMAILDKAKAESQTRKIPLKYFNVSFYKKGTCHIEFTDEELLKKFNLYGSLKKNWLPPSYGKKSYKDMNQEERQVIDDFEGEEEYKKTLLSPNYYLQGVDQVLALGEGA